MKKLLFAFMTLLAAMTCVMTGAVVGVGFYRAGYDQGTTDEQSCYETEGTSCDDDGEEQLIPA